MPANAATPNDFATPLWAPRSGLGVTKPGKLWWWVTTWVFGILMVGYLTCLVAFLNAQGKFPLRPAYFQLGMCGVCLLLLLPKRPVFSKAALLLLGFQTLKLLDALSARMPFPMDRQDVILECGSRLVITLVIVAAFGVLPRYSVKPLLWIAGLGVLVNTGGSFLEYAGFFKHSTVPGRTAGFFGDANDACIAGCCMTGVFVSLCRKFWLNFAVLGVAAIGVVPTLSRSGMLVTAIMALLFLTLNFRRHPRQVLAAVCGSFLIILTALTWMALRPTPGGGAKDANVESRISAIFQGDVSKMGSGERLKDLRDSWRSIGGAVFFGYGTGAVSSHWQPHNHFVSLWLEVGIFGLVLWLSLYIGTLVKDLYRTGGANLLSVLPVLLFIPFSHMLENLVGCLFCLISAATMSTKGVVFTLFSPSTSVTAPLHHASHA